MKRQELIRQVMEEYSNISNDGSQQHFHQTSTGISPQQYYAKLQNAVINEINKGKFDNCQSGREIINKVAADKSLISDWQQAYSQVGGGLYG